MNKFLFTFLVTAFLTGTALAQGGPSGGPGPSPVPSPWFVNGPTISYSQGGVLVGPTSLASKGIGSINVSAGYYVNGAPIAPTVGGLTGQMLNGVTSSAPAWTYTPTLGASGTLGSVSFGNGTSGLVTLGTVTGALGTVTAQLPANSGVVAELNYAQSWTATQTLQTILAGTTNTYDIGTSATVAAFRTIYAGTSFVGPTGTFTTAAGTPILAPVSDSTTALQITKADKSTRVMDFDTTNARVGINKTPGAFDLDVAGAVNFASTGAIATSLTIGGASIGSNALAVTGSTAISGVLTSAAHTVTSASAAALAVGLNGSTNPAFAVDDSTALQVAGLAVKGAATGGTVAMTVTDSGAAANLVINAKGIGTIGIGSVSTGAVTITPATTLSNALTYGGVTLTNAVTGTGKMVLDNGSSIASLTVTTALTATGLVTIGTTGDLASQAANTFVANVTNGAASPTAASLPSCTGAAAALQYTLGTGLSCGTITASASSITVGVTTVGSSTDKHILYNNAGTLGDYSVTGTGTTAVMAAAPSVVGGSFTALTALAVRDTSAAFDVTIAAVSSAALTAGRTLTLNMENVAHIVTLGTTANTGSGIIFPNAATDTVAMLGVANAFTAANTIASSSANALSVGLGTVHPAFNVNASTASQTAGLNVTGAALNGTVALAVIDTSGNTNLTINALGSGTIGIGSISTGLVTVTPAMTVTGTLTASNAFSAGSITGPLSTNLVKGVMEGDGTTITCVAGVCTALGASVTSIDAAGATAISNGTNGLLLYQAAGKVAETGAGTTATLAKLTTTDITDSSGYTNGAVVFAGGVGIAKQLNIGGTITVNLGSSSGTNFACYNTSTGLILYSTACTASSIRFKDLTGVIGPHDADRLSDLRTVAYIYKESHDPKDRSEHVGLIAEDVVAMDPRCGVYTNGELESYEDRCVLSYLVAARNDLKKIVDEQSVEIRRLKLQTRELESKVH